MTSVEIGALGGRELAVDDIQDAVDDPIEHKKVDKVEKIPTHLWETAKALIYNNYLKYFYNMSLGYPSPAGKSAGIFSTRLLNPAISSTGLSIELGEGVVRCLPTAPLGDRRLTHAENFFHTERYFDTPRKKKAARLPPPAIRRPRSAALRAGPSKARGGLSTSRRLAGAALMRAQERWRVPRSGGAFFLILETAAIAGATNRKTKGTTSMPTRQTEVQAISGPMLEETISRMANAGIQSHEIAQALILTGAGLLAGSLGPQGAGHDLRTVAAHISGWIAEVARKIEEQAN